MRAVGERLPVLVAAAGEPWEPRALEVLGAPGSGVAVQKRCVDLHDLVASARTGLARVALVAAGIPGLDADTVTALYDAGVGLVVVLPDPAPEGMTARLERLGARRLVRADLDGLAAAIEQAATEPEASTAAPFDEPLVPEEVAAGEPGHITAVWGPAGAPGRTTLATGLAAELAHRGHATFLLDADPYGGAVAQHLGVLDQVSGLLAAARSANAGQLDAQALAGIARSVGDRGLRVLTGLPRPDRWAEVRPPAFADILETAAALADHLVVDVGFDLESDAVDPFSSAPQRNGMTLAALERADRVLVVGAADPVGLARLARGLVDLRAVLPQAPLHVVVNRNRPSLGWSEAEVHGMVEGFVGAVPVTFLPEDRPTADRCLMSGRSLVELGDSPLRRAVGQLADALVPAQAPNSR